MLEKIKNLMFPCQARLDEVLAENKAAHDRLVKACVISEPRKKADFSHVADLQHIRNPS